MLVRFALATAIGASGCAAGEIAAPTQTQTSVVGAEAQLPILGPFTTTYTSCSGPASSPACAPAGTAGPSPCCETATILYWTPAAPGSYPIALAFVGAGDPITMAPWTTVATTMAQKGMIAAVVEYLNGSSCAEFLAAAQSIADLSLPTSALVQLVSAVETNPNLAGVSASVQKGIVTIGHSQGSAMAGLAGNFNPYVKAAWSMGSGDHILPGGPTGLGEFAQAAADYSACAYYANRALRTGRAINGQHDILMGGVSASRQPTYNRWNLQDVTGIGFGWFGLRSTATALFDESGTGYYEVAESEVCNPGPDQAQAGHMYFLCATSCVCQQFYAPEAGLPGQCSASAPSVCTTCDTTFNNWGGVICQAGPTPTSCPHHPEYSCPLTGDVNYDDSDPRNVRVSAPDPLWTSPTTPTWGLAYHASWLYSQVSP